MPLKVLLLLGLTAIATLVGILVESARSSSAGPSAQPKGQGPAVEWVIPPQATPCASLPLAPHADFSWSPIDAAEDVVVTFDASASQARRGQIADYVWKFGDGNDGIGKVVKHRYSCDAPSYVVALTVTDSYGCADEHTERIQSKDYMMPVYQLAVDVGERNPRATLYALVCAEIILFAVLSMW